MVHLYRSTRRVARTSVFEAMLRVGETLPINSSSCLGAQKFLRIGRTLAWDGFTFFLNKKKYQVPVFCFLHDGARSQKNTKIAGIFVLFHKKTNVPKLHEPRGSGVRSIQGSNNHLLRAACYLPRFSFENQFKGRMLISCKLHDAYSGRLFAKQNSLYTGI